MLVENCSYPKDVRVRREAETLAENGHEVTVVAPLGHGESRREDIAGVHVRRFRVPAARGRAGYVIEYSTAFWAFTLALAGSLKKGVDIVHLHNPPDCFFPLLCVAQNLGKVCIYDHHDSAPELYAEKFAASRMADRVLRQFRRLTVASADFVLTVNDTQMTILTAEAGADSCRTVVVRNYPPKNLQIVRDSEPSRGRRELGFVGELAEQDGVLALPEILHTVIALGSDVTLRIIGDGPARSKLVDTARALGVHDKIELLGWVPSEQVVSMLAKVDVCVDPAPNTPSNRLCTMVKVGDYLAAGCPVVAYRLPETEWQLDGAGILVEEPGAAAFARAVVELLRDDARYVDAAAQAARRARELTWEASARILLDVYAAAQRRVAAR